MFLLAEGEERDPEEGMVALKLSGKDLLDISNTKKVLSFALTIPIWL